MTEMLEQLKIYGKTVTDILYIIVAGVLLIFFLQRFSKRYIPLHVREKRLIQLFFGALYSLIFIISILLALTVLGFEIGEVGELAILIVLVAGFVFFLISPYLPRLPFRVGHLVKINDVFGKVKTISAYHTTIRNIDGTISFIPNTSLLGATITNFSVAPSLRVKISLNVESTCDLEKVISAILQIMRTDSRVIKDPSEPLVSVGHVEASGIDVSAICWVETEEFIQTRSDLKRQIVKEFKRNREIKLSLPQQELLLVHMDAE